MKRLLIVLFTMIAVAGVTSAQSQKEFRMGVNYFMPGDDDTWDKGVGAEAQLVFWQSEAFGIALAAGLAKWDVEEFSEGYYDPYYDVGIGVFADGDAQLIPIGVSVLYRPKMQANLKLTLEAGIRYVLVDSSVNAAAAATDLRDYVVIEDEIDIDDGIIGRLGADLSWVLAEKTSIFVGAGYQFDISKGEAKWFGEDLGDNELKAFFLQAGLSFDL